MDSPCKECIVISMCEKPCHRLYDYVADEISSHGYEMIYKGDIYGISRYMKWNPGGEKTGGWAVFNKIYDSYGHLQVLYDSKGSILMLGINKDESM